jgi:hypothetical protein
MSLTKLSLGGIIKLFPARESLVSDISAGDGKTVNLFYTVYASFAILASWLYYQIMEEVLPR